MASEKMQPREQTEESTLHLQLIAGGTAGFLQLVLLYPLDVIKTRIQLQKNRPLDLKVWQDPHYYTGYLDCIKKTAKYEGVGGFYKGFLPPLLTIPANKALKFFAVDRIHGLLLYFFDTTSPWTFAAAGLTVGITECLFTTPFEVVKIHQQANKKVDAPGTWTVAKQIVGEHGFGKTGLYRGLCATMVRNGTFNMVFFGFYHVVKSYATANKNSLQEFGSRFIIGFMSGALAVCTDAPFDVAKCRIQAPQSQYAEVKYRTTLGSIAIIYREEGWRALYKGLVIKLARLGPGGAIMLLGYEVIYDYLLERQLQ